MNRYLHIVCLDAPSPPNYGGAIDMYYKIKALADIGKKVILHYFDYNASRNADALQQYCHAVYAYKRKAFMGALPLMKPFIIQSRVNRDLITRLNEDDYPVLLEGLHCSGIIPHLNNKERVVVRMHNEESSYYRHLSKAERSFLKKQYFLQESKLLKKYQHTMQKDIKLACLSEADVDIFNSDYGFRQTFFVPCFIPWQTVSIKEERGDYCLYHGNMQVSENEEAALWLIQDIFRKIDVPLIVAGNGISKELKKEADKYKHISTVDRPSIDEIKALIQDAQVNVLPSMNNTGVKLKLLNALINGRHCITNDEGVKGSRIKKGVVIANTPADWITAIQSLMEIPFTPASLDERKPVLSLYNNLQNAEILNALW